MNIADEPLDQRYQRYKRAIAGEPLPCAIVDLDALDENVRRMVDAVPGRATIRIATKSVRCAPITKYLLGQSDKLRGLMCYSAREAAHLAGLGFDDLLIAYPSVQPADLAALAQVHTRASIVVDCKEHIEAVAAAAKRAGVVCRVVVDVDSSLRAGGVHLGARRSPIHTVADAMALVNRIVKEPAVKLHGLMVYEAHVAGLPDRNPFRAMMNAPYRAFKAVAQRKIVSLRRGLAEAFAARGLTGLVFNGAGTSTAYVSKIEHWLTEVTVGSGFFASHLFDYYQSLSLVPAAAYAVPVTRIPAPGFVTAQGGGYVASGGPGANRLPLPYLPTGLSLLKDEGAGEVQTGLAVSGHAPALGDPVFFRHAKAGELSEHFAEYLLVRGEHVVDRVRTYRGDGLVF